jgi:outer membrane protein assembly factor BamB
MLPVSCIDDEGFHSYLVAMNTRHFYTIAILSGLLVLSGCDDAQGPALLPTPRIVSVSDSAMVDDDVRAVIVIPGDALNPPRYTLRIDWGDGRPEQIVPDVEAAFQQIFTRTYFDAGEYELRCRVIDASERPSAWSEPAIVNIVGESITGRGDWWTYMRDPGRSGHSMLSGPAHPRLLWKHEHISPIHSSIVYDRNGGLYFGSDSWSLTAMYADGRPKWLYPIGTAQVRSTPMLHEDGTVLFGSNSANVYAVDRRGLKRWSVSVNAPIGFSSPAPLTDGGVVIGCSDGILYAFHADGSPRWRLISNGAIHGSPAIDRNGTIYIGSEDQILYAVDQAGGLLWTYATEAAIRGSPSIAADGSIVFGNSAGMLYSLRSDGRLNWRRDLRHPIFSTPSCSRDGRIVCVTNNGDLVSLTISGEEEWRTSYALTASRSNAVLDVNGAAYVGGPDGAVSAFDSAGRLLWRYQTDAAINSTPSIGPLGELAFANDGGVVFVLRE